MEAGFTERLWPRMLFALDERIMTVMNAAHLTVERMGRQAFGRWGLALKVSYSLDASSQQVDFLYL